MRTIPLWRIAVLRAFGMVFCLLFVACERPGAGRHSGAGAKRGNTAVELPITSYNYTEQYIDRFSVDGMGGGNVHLSSPTSGGGGIVCCFTHFPNIATRTARVEWIVDICTYDHVTQKGGTEFYEFYSRTHRADIIIEKPASAEPGVLEVHFYPNNKVLVALTSAPSPPRVIRSAEANPKLPVCLGNKKPST